MLMTLMLMLIPGDMLMEEVELCARARAARSERTQTFIVDF
jgi:hypothetical protein